MANVPVKQYCYGYNDFYSENDLSQNSKSKRSKKPSSTNDAPSETMGFVEDYTQIFESSNAQEKSNK